MIKLRSSIRIKLFVTVSGVLFQGVRSLHIKLAVLGPINLGATCRAQTSVDGESAALQEVHF